MPKLIKKFKIRKFAWLTNPEHSSPDEDSEDAGAFVYLKKNNKVDEIEKILLKSVEDELDLPEGEEFEVEEIPSMKKEEYRFSEGMSGKNDHPFCITYGVRDALEFEKSFKVTPKTLLKGIDIFVGIDGDNNSKITAISFRKKDDKDNFTTEQASQWIDKHANSLKKGELTDSMDIKEILKELTPTIGELFDKKVKPLLDMQKEQGETISGINERLLKAETPDPPPAKKEPDVDPGVELLKEMKEQGEKQVELFTEQLKKSSDELSARLKTIEEIPFESVQEHNGIGRTLKKGSEVETESGYIMSKGADGKIRFSSKEKKEPTSFQINITKDMLKEVN